MSKALETCFVFLLLNREEWINAIQRVTDQLRENSESIASQDDSETQSLVCIFLFVCFQKISIPNQWREMEIFKGKWGGGKKPPGQYTPKQHVVACNWFCHKRLIFSQTLDSFSMLRVLGKGTFGKVHIILTH
jgi:hypothetical protein